MRSALSFRLGDYSGLWIDKGVIYSGIAPMDVERRSLKPDSDNWNLLERELRPSTSADAPVPSGYDVRGAAPVPVSKYSLDAEVGIVTIIFETVSAWVVGLGMRLEIKRDLGREATQADLTSIET